MGDDTGLVILSKALNDTISRLLSELSDLTQGFDRRLAKIEDNYVSYMNDAKQERQGIKLEVKRLAKEIEAMREVTKQVDMTLQAIAKRERNKVIKGL